MTFTDYLNLYWHSWTIEAVVLALIAAVIFFNWKKITKIATSHMIISAIVIWIMGLVLYCIGFAYEGSARSFTAYFFRSALASMEMFLSNNELVEVSGHYKESTPYMVCFSVVHLSAVCLSAIFIINTIGFRIKHLFLAILESVNSSRELKPTYVFWSITDPGIALASDIRAKHPEARILFVRPTGDSSLGERLEMTEMMSMGTSYRKSMEIARTMDGIEDVVVIYTADDVKGTLRSKRVAKILRNSSLVRFFFFSADEKENLKNGAVVFSDPVLTQKEAGSVEIFSLNAHGGNNKIMRDQISIARSQGKPIDWTFVDPSYLSVASLKHKLEYHPVNCMPEDSVRDGAVSGVFTAMVLGFGYTGQELFKFFTEFSSFAGVDGKPARRNMILVDKNMDRKAGPMCITNPGLFHTDSVKLIASDAGTVEFWRSIREYAEGINCVSIALGSDDIGMNIAMDVYRAIIQYSPSKPKNVKIFIRIYSHENEVAIRRLADNYNIYKDETGIEVVPFGGISEIFTCKVIMEKDILRSAREFNYHVGQLSGMNDGVDPAQAWARDFSVKKHLDTLKAVPLAIDEMTRKAMQCYSSSLFVGTLLSLAGVDPSDKEMLRHFVDLGASRGNRSFRYVAATEAEQKLMDNLALAAHERLVSSHWLLGYREMPATVGYGDPAENARQKYSEYAIPWDRCSRDIQLLAYTVVDTSFIVALENLG